MNDRSNFNNSCQRNNARLLVMANQATQTELRLFDMEQQNYKNNKEEMQHQRLAITPNMKVVLRQIRQQKSFFLLVDEQSNKSEWFSMAQLLKWRIGRQIYSEFLKEDQKRLWAQMSSDDEFEPVRRKATKRRLNSIFCTPPSKNRQILGQDLECHGDRQSPFLKILESGSTKAIQINPERTPQPGYEHHVFMLKHQEMSRQLMSPENPKQSLSKANSVLQATQQVSNVKDNIAIDDQNHVLNRQSD